MEKSVIFDLLQTLYSATQSTDGWLNFLNKLCNVTNSSNIWLITTHQASDSIISQLHHSTCDTASTFYKGQYPLIKNKTLNKFICSQRHLTEQERQHPFWDEWARPQNLFYSISASIPVLDNYNVALHLFKGDGEQYSNELLDELNALLPQIKQALNIYYELQHFRSKKSKLVNELDFFQTAIIVINSAGFISQANKAAKELIDDSTIPITVNDNNHLQITSDSGTNRFLHHCIQEAMTAPLKINGPSIKSFSSPITLVRENLPPLTIMTRPIIHSQDNEKEPSVIVLFYLPEITHTPSKEVLRLLFNLTKSEAELCFAIAEGLSLEQIAKDQHKSVHTLRGYLKSLFTKTGTKRQAQLVARVFSSPAYLLQGLDNLP